MSEPIVTKTCWRCKMIQPIVNFHKASKRKDGHQSVCKLCNKQLGKIYQQSEKGKASMKLRIKRYRLRHPQRIKTQQKRYWQSERGKINHRQAAQNHHNRYPERATAYHAVEYAITVGKIKPPTKLKCALCPQQAKHYHHPNGYNIEHHFDIIPVCRKCHIAL